MKRIILLGSTGSIGLNTLQVVREYPDQFSIVGLVANSNIDSLLNQIKEFRPESVCCVDSNAALRFEKEVPKGVRVYTGSSGVREVAQWKTGEVVLAASSGSSSLIPVMDAIRCGKDIALANKEILVMAGRIIMREAHERKVRLLPIDSEHNAIFQCLQGSRPDQVKRLLLTGSGGPLKDLPASEFKGISKEVVIRHPKWSMGKKISVDSATMMNKGLEMIEAQWLFGVASDQIKVLVHPEAVVHSMVEYIDGSIIAQLGPTDMKSPILHVLSFPDRYRSVSPGVDLTRLGPLHFMEPELQKFPCLGIAQDIARKSDSTLPCVLNAADEVAVDAFLRDEIDFTEIPIIIQKVIEAHHAINAPSLEQILDTDRWTRDEASRLFRKRKAQTV